MNGFNEIPYANAENELKVLYDEISTTLDTEILPNWVTYLGGNVHLLRGIWNMFQGMALNGSLSPLLQELVIFGVSYTQGSEYCSEFHARQILKLKTSLDFHQLQEILSGNSHGLIPDSYSAAIEFSINHTQSNCLLKQEETGKLVDAGFSLQEVEEIIGLCSLALAFNTLTMGACIPIDDSQRVEGFKLVRD